MKKFKFRLERILEYRKLIKDEKAKELILARNKLYADEAHLEELERARLNNILQSDILTAEELQMVGLYADRLKRDIERQKKVIIESEKAVEKAQEIYIEAAKDEESLAKLKERRRSEYLAYIEKEELKNIDEMNTQRAGFEKVY